MAVSSTHSVTAQNVLDELPVQTSKITATSNRINTSKVTDWIERASGVLNALLTKAGIDPTSLGDDESELVRSGIIAYAAGQASVVMQNIPADVRSSYWDDWKDVKKILRESPQELGSAQDATDIIVSNIDPTDATTKEWDTDGFGGF